MIEFRSVTKKFPDGTVAVDDFSLVIPSHKTTVLVGSSGSGKTTLLRCFNRVNERYGNVTTEGEIKLLGKAIGAMAAALDGMAVLVFAGGIGEHAAAIRTRICARLGHLGVRLDEHRNAANAAVISSDDSAVVVRIIATDEQWMMAENARVLLAAASAEQGPNA